MESISSFLSMGGYASYVWPSYAVALVVLGALLAASVRTLRARQAAFGALENDEANDEA